MSEKKPKLIEFDTKMINDVFKYGESRNMTIFSQIIRRIVQNELYNSGITQLETNNHSEQIHHEDLTEKQNEILSNFIYFFNQYDKAQNILNELSIGLHLLNEGYFSRDVKFKTTFELLLIQIDKEADIDKLYEAISSLFVVEYTKNEVIFLPNFFTSWNLNYPSPENSGLSYKRNLLCANNISTNSEINEVNETLTIATQYLFTYFNSNQSLNVTKKTDLDKYNELLFNYSQYKEHAITRVELLKNIAAITNIK